MGNAKYKQSHKEKGLCVSCSRKAIPGMVLCAVHSESQRQRDLKRYWNNHEYEKNRLLNDKRRRRKEGRCTMCGKPLNDEENIVCINCSQDNFRPQGLPLFQGY